jgi:hypothetical protein
MYQDSNIMKNAYIDGTTNDKLIWTYLNDSTLSANSSFIEISSYYDDELEEDRKFIYALPVVDLHDTIKINIQNTIRV